VVVFALEAVDIGDLLLDLKLELSDAGVGWVVALGVMGTTLSVHRVKALSATSVTLPRRSR
jgi:hypothetical protein